MFLVFAFGGPRGGNGGGIATLANAGQMAMIALFLCQLLGGRVSLANFLPNGAFLPNAIRGVRSCACWCSRAWPRRRSHSPS